MGIELDSIHMLARLPQEKITKCCELISNFLSRKSVTLHNLQVLLGTLNFACSVLSPGRAFLRRLIDLSIGVSKPSHHIRLTKEAKEDLRTWLEFLSQYNCKSFFQDEFWTSSEKMELYTDASGSVGFGGLLGSQWFYGLWGERCKDLNIAILELYPILLAIYLFGSKLKNKCILFLTDNQAIVHILNKQSSKDKSIMILVCKLVLICLQMNIFFKAKHVPGIFNGKADALSRSQISEFHIMHPRASPNPESIPQNMELTKLLQI